MSAQDTGSIALCDGVVAPSPGLCARKCGKSSCANGQTCVAGVCSQLPSQTSVHVTVDASARYQVLTGFGATLGPSESSVVEHPRQPALYEAMFGGLGLDVLRLRSRYGDAGDDDLSTAGDLVRAATASLARTPTVYLASWSPPAALKANGSLVCRGNADTCTLAQAAGGGFDYAGYGAYWRAALNAYAAVGIMPDYIGIQNNPDYVPSATAPGEGCKFLPTEGTVSVPGDGGIDAGASVLYPGFDQAMAAVVAAIAGLSPVPKLAAPEVSYAQSVFQYALRMDFSHVDAIAHHLYGTDPTAIDLGVLNSLAQLGRNYNRPIFQSEMQSDGFSTALLMHYALAVEGVSAYLQGALAAPPNAMGNPGLVSVSGDDFSLEDAYHAMRHYAFHTDPGWIRVGATSDAQGVLASAWLSPSEDALTVVLVNSETAGLDAKLALGFAASSSSVTRTVFDGVERSAELGPLAPEGILRVPARSIITVAARR